ncbi:MAG: hypothetical protein ABI876_12940 [Bacteroidota bacterium]
MPAKRKHGAWSIPGEEGRIRGRGSGRTKRAYLRFGDQEESLGFAFTRENMPLGLKILRERQNLRKLHRVAEKYNIELPGHLKTAVEQQDTLEAVPERWMSLQEMIEDFKEATYPHSTLSVQSHHNRAIAYYIRKSITWDVKSDDLIEQAHEAIYLMVKEAHSSEELNVNTKVKYYDYLIPIFDHLVKRKWLKTNPVRDLKRPQRQRGSRRGRWTEMEMELIMYQMEKVDASGQFAMATRLLLLTGVRDGEALKMTRTHAVGKFIPACSKVNPRTREDTTRWIPVDLIPNLRWVVDQLLTMPVKRGRDFLLPWRDLNKWRAVFNAAVDLAGIERRDRTLNCCRKSAIWWLEQELLWPRQDIEDMVGHAEDVDDEYYRDVPERTELADRIKRRMEQRSTD